MAPLRWEAGQPPILTRTMVTLMPKGWGQILLVSRPGNTFHNYETLKLRDLKTPPPQVGGGWREGVVNSS